MLKARKMLLWTARAWVCGEPVIITSLRAQIRTWNFADSKGDNYYLQSSVKLGDI
jgi:hypothetical protein